MPPDLSPLWISLKVAGLATAIAFTLGVAAARWMLGYRGGGRALLEGLFVAPLVLPPTVVGFLLLLLLGRSGPLGAVLQALGLRLVFTWYGAVIAAAVVAFPLAYRTALGAFQQIDPTLLQVARTLGARESRIFGRILLPLAGPGLLAGLTLTFARALGEFGATLMVAGNIPGLTQTLPMAIYFAVEAGAMGEAGLWVAVIMAVSLSGLIVVNRGQGRRGKRRGRPRDGASGLGLSAAARPRAKAKGQHFPPAPVCLPQELPSPPGQAPLLQVNIHKSLATFPLTLAFNAGSEPLGILGASGAGKSMTLRCIAGVEAPTSGRIVLNGRVLFDRGAGINLPPHQRRVGLLFQNYALFPHLTVAENIGFGLLHLPRPERGQRVQGWLSAMQLEGLGDRYPGQLSGGQRQRVALARALAPEPEALLLDEPLSALDTYLRSQVEQQLMATLATFRGVALFVTHNLDEVFRVCPQIVVMAAGQAIAAGPRHQIFEQPGTIAAARVTGCKNFSRAVATAAAAVWAEDWGCPLTVVGPIPADLGHVGFRAHQLTFVDGPREGPQRPNTFACWVVGTSETPHRMTLFLRLHSPPPPADTPTDASGGVTYHLQAELFKERWHEQAQRRMPWYIHLAPERVLLLGDCPPPSLHPEPTIPLKQ